jgi:hypothetical protein
MRRPVPIRMRSRGDCPVLAMSPDPKRKIGDEITKMVDFCFHHVGNSWFAGRGNFVYFAFFRNFGFRLFIDRFPEKRDPTNQDLFHKIVP